MYSEGNTPWDMLVNSMEKIDILEQKVSHLGSAVISHQEIIKQLLIQNERLAKQNREITKYVKQLTEKSTISKTD